MAKEKKLKEPKTKKLTPEQEEHNRRIREREKIESDAKQVYSSASICFSGPEGKVFLDHLKNTFFCSSSTARMGADGKVDQMAMALNEGSRNVVMYIEELLNATPEMINVRVRNMINSRERNRRTGV